jgi:hypothetical protein
MLQASSMPPPPMHHMAAAVPTYRPSSLSSHKHHGNLKQGPDVHVLSVWSPRPSLSTLLLPHLAGPSISSTPIDLLHGSIGYNAQHLQYMGQQARWAHAAQQGVPTTEIILLGITVVHEGGAKWRHPRSNTVGVSCSLLIYLFFHTYKLHCRSLMAQRMSMLNHLHNSWQLGYLMP